MIFVDASVWIDEFRDVSTPQTERLSELTGEEQVAVGDLTLAEVLRGCRDQREFDRTLARLRSYPVVDIGGRDVALAAATNYRLLRDRGTTVRGMIDCLVAARCILDGHALLFSDRDFAPFVEWLGLRDGMHGIDEAF